MYCIYLTYICWCTQSFSCFYRPYVTIYAYCLAYLSRIEIHQIWSYIDVRILKILGWKGFLSLLNNKNTKRDFYSDVYTILNRILLSIWTICAFRVLNPRHWSLAKQFIVEKRWLKIDAPKVPKTNWTQKGWCNKATELQFQLHVIWRWWAFLECCISKTWRCRR